MCADRCFSNPNESNTSSDYTKSTKQKTIFKDVVNQVQNNFIKSNGVNYNENFGLHNNCLAFAKSYDLLLDVTKGKYYTKPVEDTNWASNEAWSAGLYSIDYSANGVNVVVDTSYNAGNGNHIIFPMTQSAELADISWNGLYPGVRVDPSYNIFYNECDDQNYWRKKLVDMSFNTTNYYKQNKQQSKQLYGMVYPGNVTFTCGNEKNYKYFAYVANSADTPSGSVSGYSIDSTSGNLTFIQKITSGLQGPRVLTVVPNGTFLYVANNTNHSISGYKINQTTGFLTYISNIVITEQNPAAMTIDPTGNFLYVTTNTNPFIHGYKINSDGTLTFINRLTTGGGPEGVTVSMNGKFVYVATALTGQTNDIYGYNIAPTTGVLSAITGSPFFSNVVGEKLSITVVPNRDFVYATNDVAGLNNDKVCGYTINLLSGVLTEMVNSFDALLTPSAIAVDPTGNFIYVTNDESDKVSAYRIQPSGDLTKINDYASGEFPNSISIDPTGKFLYVTNIDNNNISGYKIDSNTGALTNITTSPFTAGAQPLSIITVRTSY